MLFGLLLIGAGPIPAHARELIANAAGDRYLALDTSLKWTTLLSRAGEDTLLFPERWSGAQLWRLRFTARSRPLDWLTAEVAYEHSARGVSEGAGAAGGTGVFPATGWMPYRLDSLSEEVVGVGETFTYRHELDRALVSARWKGNELTVGRQAIGWGRGLFFSATDFFAPFSPLESDREWRRGIDAARARVPITDRIALDLVAALGEESDYSAYVGRIHGYIRAFDWGLQAGRRGEDDLVAASASMPVGDAEIHGEAAVYAIPEFCEDGSSGGCGHDNVTQTLIGGSYSLDTGAGIHLAAEYHYSGFGARRASDLTPLLLSWDYWLRMQRGDVRILGRHATALQITYGIGAETPVSLTWIASPSDGSGVLMPTLSWAVTDFTSLQVSGRIAHGSRSRAGVLRSEYGGTPTTGLVQIGFTY